MKKFSNSELASNVVYAQRRLKVLQNIKAHRVAMQTDDTTFQVECNNARVSLKMLDFYNRIRSEFKAYLHHSDIRYVHTHFAEQGNELCEKVLHYIDTPTLDSNLVFDDTLVRKLLCRSLTESEYNAMVTGSQPFGKNFDEHPVYVSQEELV